MKPSARAGRLGRRREGREELEEVLEEAREEVLLHVHPGRLRLGVALRDGAPDLPELVARSHERRPVRRVQVEPMFF